MCSRCVVKEIALYLRDGNVSFIANTKLQCYEAYDSSYASLFIRTTDD